MSMLKGMVKFSLMECLRELASAQESACLDLAATMRLGAFDHICSGLRASEMAAGNNLYTPRHPLMLQARQPGHALPLFAPAYDVLDLVGERAWFNSEFYQDHFRRFGLKAHINTQFGGPDSAVHWGVGLARETSRRPPKGLLATLTHLAPHISRALNNLAIWNMRWAGAQALAEHTREAMALVRLGSPGRSPDLQLATPEAARLLGLHSRPGLRNLHLQEFLRLCVLAVGAAGGAVLWQATDGRHYALAARRITVSEQILVVALTAPDCQPSRPGDCSPGARAGLSRREAEVFALLARGLANKQIARELHIAISTARTHVEHIFRKLKVGSRIEAINVMRSHGQQHEPEQA